MASENDDYFGIFINALFDFFGIIFKSFKEVFKMMIDNLKKSWKGGGFK